MKKPLVLSICMMIKNEEANLRRCLKSLQLLREAVESELIIVDTGSTDSSVAIALEYTEKVYHHPWNNDFSAMRNISIGYATGQWVLIIDADEELVEAQPLIEFFSKPQGAEIGGAIITCINILGLEEETAPIPSIRVFRRNKDFYYEGIVHNQPNFKGNIVTNQAKFYHYGYNLSDKELMERKFQRTTALLIEILKKEPNHFYYRFQLAISYSMHLDHFLALKEALAACEAYVKQHGKIVRDVSYLLGTVVQFYMACNIYSDEAVAAAYECVAIEPEYVDAWFFLAQMHAKRGEFEKAYESYSRYLELVGRFDSLMIRYNISISLYTLEKAAEAHFNMAVLSLKLKKTEQARMHATALLTSYSQNDAERLATLKLIVEIDFVEGEFAANSEFYANFDEEKSEIIKELLTNAEQFYVAANATIRYQYSRIMANYPGIYGKLNRFRIGEFSATMFAASALQEEINSLPPYFAPLLFGLMEDEALCKDVNKVIAEDTYNEFMKYLDIVMRDEFIERAKVYLENLTLSTTDFEKAKFVKNIGKYLVFSGALDEIEFEAIFTRYYEAGVLFLQGLYQPRIFEQTLYCDLKNIEEAFLLLMRKVQQTPNFEKKFQLLEQARTLYPDMALGIKCVLKKLSSEIENSPWEELIEQLLQQVHRLMQEGDYQAALDVVAEATNIVGKDIRLLLVKTEILSKQYSSGNQ